MKNKHFILNRADRVSNGNQFLLTYRFNVTSQYGEDGIIEQIFRIMPVGDKTCCEFGAWDGKHLSNTYNLIQNYGWSAVLIEGNKERSEEILKKTYFENKKVQVHNVFVNITGNTNLDSILTKSNISHNFDFLSIDIDGNDWHVWNSLKQFKPNVVLCEYNCSIPDNIEFVQEPNFSIRHGHSILSLVKLAKEKGYELISINANNAFFVDEIYFHLFKISDNSIGQLKHFNEPLQIFSLYDGSLVYYGYQSLHFHNIPMDFNKRFQMIPKYLRDAGLPWGDSGKWKRRIMSRIIKFYAFIYRDNQNAKQDEYITKHWIKWPETKNKT